MRNDNKLRQICVCSGEYILITSNSIDFEANAAFIIKKEIKIYYLQSIRHILIPKIYIQLIASIRLSLPDIYIFDMNIIDGIIV